MAAPGTGVWGDSFLHPQLTSHQHEPPAAMEQSLEAATQRPHGLVAKIMTQPHYPSSSSSSMTKALGNQKPDESDESSGSDDDAPETLHDSGRFRTGSLSSSSLSSQSQSPSSSAAAPSVATPPSSPESSRQTHDATRVGTKAWDDSPEDRDSVGSETDGSFGDDVGQETAADGDHQEQQQQQQESAQLQSDVVVLAAHLQQQTLALDHERGVNQSLQSQLLTTQQSCERELESILIENDALRHQNATLLAARTASDLRAETEREAHDEVLRALETQQQRDAHARTIIAALVKERDALKRQLDESKTYCRRLEEDVVTLRAEQQHLRAENDTLQTAVKAATSHRNDRELRMIREQELTIESLRADLLQMEFEFQTLSVDKDKLHHRVTTLQRQSESRSTTSYDVISLGGEPKKKTKRLSLSAVITASSKDKDAARDSDRGTSFTNLMTLPNCVDDGSRTASGSVSLSVSRPRTPVGSLVSKTLSSAKKKLFQPSTHTSTVVLPQ